jgi:hypothetical protein
MDASRVEDRLHELVGQLRPAVVAEVRKYLAEALRGVAEASPVDDPGLPGGAMPAHSDEDSFLAGVQWAAALVADENFDF